MRREHATFVLLIVGSALLLNPFVPGVHLGSETVYRYDAAAVDYAPGEGFNLTAVSSATALEPLPVDDQIACEADTDRRHCSLERFVLRNGSVPTHATAGFLVEGRHEYVVIDGRLHRPTTVERGGRAWLALDPVNDSVPLREVAATDLSPVERQAVESGRVVTYRNLSRRQQLLRVDGDYFVVRQSARKRYARGHDSCHSYGQGFCDRADWKRRTDTALTLVSRIAGLALTFRGWERIRH